MNTTRIVIALVLALLGATDLLYAQQPQKDSPNTLDWVQRRANRVDTLLYGAVISQEPVYLLLKIWDAWHEFDAVAQAGVYCQAARTAAEKGRQECDLLGYERDQDVNAMIARATEARRQAHRMRLAAQSCAADTATAPDSSPTFTLSDVLLSDAQIIELDLTDAKASHDMHIISQKIGHTLRILRDIERLIWSMDDCDTVLLATQAIKGNCQTALASSTWEEAAPFLDKALEEVYRIKGASAECR